MINRLKSGKKFSAALVSLIVIFTFFVHSPVHNPIKMPPHVLTLSDSLSVSLNGSDAAQNPSGLTFTYNVNSYTLLGGAEFVLTTNATSSVYFKITGLSSVLVNGTVDTNAAVVPLPQGFSNSNYSIAIDLSYGGTFPGQPSSPPSQVTFNINTVNPQAGAYDNSVFNIYTYNDNYSTPVPDSSANPVNIAPNTVNHLVFTPGDYSPQVGTYWTVSYYRGGGTLPSGGTITLVFPPGTGINTSVLGNNLGVNGFAAYNLQVTSNSSGVTLTFQVQASETENSQVTIQLGIPGISPITNPPAATYPASDFQASDSVDFSPANNQSPIVIATPGPVSNVSYSFLLGKGSSKDTWTVTFDTGSIGLQPGMQFEIEGPPGTAFPAGILNYTFNGQPFFNSPSLANQPSNSGATSLVLLSSPVYVSPNTAVTVVIANVSNPPQGTYPSSDFGVLYSQDPVFVSPSSSVTFGPPTPVSNVSLNDPSQVPGAQVNITLNFTTSSTGILNADQNIYVTLPSGFAFNNPSNTNVSVNGLQPVQATVSGQTLTVVINSSIGQSSPVSVVFPVTNGPSGTYPGSTFTVSTDTDTVAASPSQGVIILSGVSNYTLTYTLTQPNTGLAPNTAGQSATWSYSFTLSSQGSLSSGQSVYLGFPHGTQFPTSNISYSITVGSQSGVNPSAVNVNSSTGQVQLTLANSIASNSQIVVSVSGVVNPPQGSYPATAFDVSTSSDVLNVPLSASQSFIPNVSLLVFNVNTTNDTNQANLGSGICSDSSGSCSLRAAIQETDSDINSSVQINIPGISGSNFNITLGSVLQITTHRNVVITGGGEFESVISGNNITRIFSLTGSGNVQLSNVQLIQGLAPNDGNGGAAIFEGFSSNLFLNNDYILFNATSSGPGGAVDALGNIYIRNTVFFQNKTTDPKNGSGGALYCDAICNLVNDQFYGNSAAVNGGAVTVSSTQGANANRVFIEDSAFNSNSSGSSNPTSSLGGGGILCSAFCILDNDSIISNTTSSGHGSGIDVNGQVWLSFTTIYQNTSNASPASTGVYVESNAIFAYKANIIAGNNGGDCTFGPNTILLNDVGYNLSSDGSCSKVASDATASVSSLNLAGVQTRFGVLGIVEYEAPQAQSAPEVGFVPQSQCVLLGLITPLQNDQISDPRPSYPVAGTFAPTCEAGSIEFSGGVPEAVYSTVQIAPSSLPVTSSAQVVVTLNNGSGPLSSHSVSLTTSSTTAQVTPSSVITNQNGQATFTISDSVVEAVTVYAQDANLPVTLNDNPVVSFEPSSTKSYMIAEPGLSQVELFSNGKTYTASTAPLPEFPFSDPHTLGWDVLTEGNSPSIETYNFSSTSGLSLISKIALPGTPRSAQVVAGSPTSDTIAWVTLDNPDELAEIDITSGTILKTLLVGAGPAGLAINASNNTAYVTNFGAGCLSEVDLTALSGTYAIKSILCLGTNTYPEQVIYDAAANTVYVICSNSIVSVSSSSFTIQNQVVASGNAIFPTAAALDPSATHLLVVSGASNQLVEYDPSTLVQTNSVRVGLNPMSIAIDSTANAAVITNDGDNTYQVLNLTNFQLSPENALPAGGVPSGVAIGS